MGIKELVEDQEAAKVKAVMYELEGQIKRLQELEKRQKMLALNASIEAARAGTFGAGFGIVANEVSNLSDEFGKCNTSIKNRLDELMVSVNKIIQTVQS